MSVAGDTCRTGACEWAGWCMTPAATDATNPALHNANIISPAGKRSRHRLWQGI
jgi:hypothetical protein